MKNSMVLSSTVLMTVLLFSCTHPTEKAFKVAASDIANLECRAFALRTQRFELANKMRFKQDSLSMLKLHQDSQVIQQQLAKMNLQKDSILTASLRLADSIKIKMDYVLSHYITDKEKEKEFNRELDALLAKNGYK